MRSIDELKALRNYVEQSLVWFHRPHTEKLGLDVVELIDAEIERTQNKKCRYCDSSREHAEGLASFDAILVPKYCDQCGRRFDDENS